MKYICVWGLILLFVGSIEAQKEYTAQISVQGNCGHCQERIEETAMSMPGILSASWSGDTKTLEVTSVEPIDIDRLEMEIAFAGHDTEHQLAPDDVYNSLPGCCMYRDSDMGSLATDASLAGNIVEEQGEQLSPVIGATISWIDGSHATVTDTEGRFMLPRTADVDEIVVSYVGYQPDTIDVENEDFVSVTLQDLDIMEGITVTHKRRSTRVSFVNPIKMQEIDEKELFKAACCNLSESFETNATVDASSTDAITGIRQIRMLGLEGPNVLLTREAIPIARGINSLYGLHYIPGSWIRGMSLNTGIGSVLNGFDGHAGQIDVGIKQPCEGDRLFVNLFANAASRMEANIVARQRLNDRLSTALLLHANTTNKRNDMNDDGYIDRPVQDMVSLMNRWKYNGSNGWRAQFGIGMHDMDGYGGQLEYRPDSDSEFWGSDTEISQYYGWLKIGKVYTDRPQTSLGFQFNYDHSDQDLLFGQRRYLGTQNNYYSQLSFHTTLDPDARHLIKFAINGQLLHADEQFSTHVFERDERSVGLITEYSYLPNTDFSLVTGLRVDHHNQYGTFVTPRLHIRKAITDELVIRLGAGRAQRTANPLSESVAQMASNRAFIFSGNDDDTPYGFDPTVAWSIGTNLTYDFKLGGKPALLQANYYLTTFTKGLVRDVDESPQAVHFYNLDGSSRSHSVQLQMDYEILERLDLRAAYRFNDVRTDLRNFDHQLHPLQAPHRFFVNTAYETKNGWMMDLTGNWLSKQRLPRTSSNPTPFQLDEYSPDFIRWNTQITKSWGEWLSVYVGVNNIFNYQQDNAILSGENPDAPYFDGSIIWGPIFGREWYMGVRYHIAYE